MAASIFAISLGSAVGIDRARERIDRYILRAEHADKLVDVNLSRAADAARIARQAELVGDLLKARRYFDESEGRARLAEYHRMRSRLYLTQGVRIWQPEPVEPRPPRVRLIPERAPGMGPGPTRLANRDADPRPDASRGP